MLHNTTAKAGKKKSRDTGNTSMGQTNFRYFFTTACGYGHPYAMILGASIR